MEEIIEFLRGLAKGFLQLIVGIVYGIIGIFKSFTDEQK